MDGLVNRRGEGDPRDVFFEQVELWPVRLTFLTATGITLWGSAGTPDRRDRIFTVASRLVLAGSELELRAFVVEYKSSSMEGLPGYELLRQRARDGSVTLEEHATFNYRALVQTLEWPPELWNQDAFSALVDALNMLSDLAEAIQDDELLALFDSPRYVALLERLTFLTEDKVREAGATLDRPMLRQVLGMGIDHVERKIAPR